MDRLKGIGAEGRFYQSDFESLDIELEYAKEHAFKVNLEFDRRFKVWRDVILRNHRLHLAVTYGDEQTDLFLRYKALNESDLKRLLNRAAFEFLDWANDRKTSQTALIVAKNLYWQRKRQLITLFTVQLKKYYQLLDIYPATVIGETKELTNARHGKYAEVKSTYKQR